MRRLAPFVLSALLLAGTAACGQDAERDGSGAVTAADEVSVEKLRVGDCLETPADGVVVDLKAIPCSEPHDGEVYHSFELPDGDFPGETQVQQLGETGCVEQFTAFVGTSFEESELGLLPLTPVAEGWEQGDQGVLCIVQDEEGGLTTTLKGAER